MYVFVFFLICKIIVFVYSLLSTRSVLKVDDPDCDGVAFPEKRVKNSTIYL